MFITNTSNKQTTHKKFYSPFTYLEKLEHYKKHNSKIRAKYYDLAHKHKSMHKLHVVFTSPKKNKFTKLEHVTEIRSHFNKLLLNLKLEGAYTFSNIEMGEDLDNPHLDMQLWLNYEDVKRLNKIYLKTIHQFNLLVFRCTFNEFSPTSEIEIFHYTVKEYKKNMSDEEIYKLGEAKKNYRKVLKKNIRFFSHTRNKYSQKTYKLLYKTFGLTYKEAEHSLNNKLLTIRNKKQIVLNLEIIRKLKIRHLIYIYLTRGKKNVFLANYYEKMFRIYFSCHFWIFMHS